MASGHENRASRSYEGGASKLRCGHPKLEDLLMLQTVAALFPAAVDYERTLVLAIEVSNKSWVLAAQVPGLPHTKAKRTVNPEAEALLAAIAGYRTRAAATGRSIERVIAVYEAGWSGFWLARLAYKAWGGSVRYPAFQRAGRSSDAPRQV